MSDSFNDVISQWVDDNSWPQGAEEDRKVVLLIDGTTSDGKTFQFRSGTHYFEVHATHDSDNSQLKNLWVLLVVPGYHRLTTLTGAESYSLSSDEAGDDLVFSFGDDVIKGTVSFQYDTTTDITMTYDVTVPFAGDLVDTISLSPQVLNSDSGFTTDKFKALSALAPALKLHAQLFKEESLSLVKGRYSVRAASSGGSTTEHQLLLNYLGDFARDSDKVVVETYYPSDQSDTSTSLTASGDSSKQYTVSISFLSIFDLEGSIDPSSLSAAVGVFIRVPIAGRVRLTNIKGSLKSGAGVTATINAIVAKGTATLKAKRASSTEKYKLYVNLSLEVKLVGKVTTTGDLYLLTLPF